VHPLLLPFYRAAVGIVSTAARVVPPGEHKLQRAIAARRDATDRLVAWGRAHRDRSRRLLWVHAPSVGEGLQARPLLEQWRRQYPQDQLLYTYFSPSAEPFAARLDVDFAGYLPFDSLGSAQRAIDALSPAALVFAKLDVWPQLVEVAVERAVPTAIISATLPEGSGRSGWLARAALRDAYAALTAVGAIDPDDASRLITLGVRADRITITGDTRYDQVIARTAALDRTTPLWRVLMGTRPTVVAGSTWPSDEAVLFPAFVRLRDTVRDARLIIAPHEPTEAHLEPIQSWASAASLRAVRLSALLDGAPTRDADVVVVDRVGVLGDLYGLAQMAFVGGGFHRAGLHSVLEPAAYGVPVLFGPGGDRVRDARALSTSGGGRLVHDVESLAAALLHWCRAAGDREGAGREARALVERGRGATERSVALLRGVMR
jgi:3-deoxy-D-manno-octulosonic-acid transferase